MPGPRRLPALVLLLGLAAGRAAASPAWLATTVPPGTAAGTDVAVVGDRAVLGTAKAKGPRPELHVLDLQTPTAPLPVGAVDLNASVRRIALAGSPVPHTAFVVTTGPNALMVVAIDPPDAAHVLATVPLPGPPLTVAVNGPTVWVGLKNAKKGPELLAFDVSDPAAPAPVGAVEAGGSVHDVAATPGGVLLVASGRDDAELTLLQAADPAAPVAITSYDVPGGADGVAVALTRQRVLLATGANGGVPALHVLGIQPPGIFVEEGALSLGVAATRMAVRDHWVWLAGPKSATGLRVVDVADPAAPGLARTVPTPAAVPGVALRGPHAHLALKSAQGPLGVVDADLPLRGEVYDRNDDGRIVVSCLGDSNGIFPPRTCDLLAQLVLPDDVEFVVRAEFGAPAVASPDPGFRDGFEQMDLTLAEDAPDVVVVAFGSNDIRSGHTPAEALTAYQQLAALAEAAGALPLLALAPPMGGTLPGDPLPLDTYNQNLAALNDLIRGAFPADRVVDFWTPIVGATDFVDGIHVNARGAAKRAMALYERLLFAD